LLSGWFSEQFSAQTTTRRKPQATSDFTTANRTRRTDFLPPYQSSAIQAAKLIPLHSP
jgi:hypothetical protein